MEYFFSVVSVTTMTWQWLMVDQGRPTKGFYVRWDTLLVPEAKPTQPLSAR